MNNKINKFLANKIDWLLMAVLILAAVLRLYNLPDIGFKSNDEFYYVLDGRQMPRLSIVTAAKMKPSEDAKMRLSR